VARQGRALIFEGAGRRDDLQREAAAICADLENGRWMLARGDFEHAYSQARAWLADPRPSIDRDRLALAEAADSLWRESQTISTQAPTGRSRRIVQAGDVSVLVLTRSTPERYTALLMAPRFLESAWLDGLRLAGRVQGGIEFALTDAEGRPDGSRPAGCAAVDAIRAGRIHHAIAMDGACHRQR
jgi:hypothetical protein